MNQNLSLKRVWGILIFSPILLGLITTIAAAYFVMTYHLSGKALNQAITNEIPYCLMINHSILFIILLYFLKKDNLNLNKIGYTIGTGFKSLFLLIVIGLVSGLILGVISNNMLIPLFNLVLSHFTGISSGPFRPGKGFPMIPMIIGMTLFAGIVEESIYRGYAITVLQSRYGKSWAVIISSIFFSFLHWGGRL